MLGVSPTGQKAVVAIEDHDFGAPALSDDVFGELLGLGFGAASGEEHERQAGRLFDRPSTRDWHDRIGPGFHLLLLPPTRCLRT